MTTKPHLPLFLNDLVEKGKHFLHQGIKEAQKLAEATAETTNMQVELRRKRVECEHSQSELGKELCASLRKDAEASMVKLTKSMRERITRITELEGDIAELDEALKHRSVTRRD